VDRPVSERRGERLVDEPVLLDQREPVEAAARDRHLEVVAAAGAILDRDLARVGERVAQKRLERLGDGHGIIVAAGRTRSTAGNVVELGSIVAFGFSPLWLLAGASDISRGSRVYLESLVSELKRAGVLAEQAELGTVDDLLSALEGASGTTARLVDLPPLELAELRASLAELRTSAAELPSPQELAALYAGLQRTAARERRPLLEVSSGIGLAFMLSARNVGREHLVTSYREDWRPLREEGFAAYSRRVSEPYRDAVAGHFDSGRASWTDRVLGRLRR
jgi:hypothetical protein